MNRVLSVAAVLAAWSGSLFAGASAADTWHAARSTRYGPIDYITSQYVDGTCRCWGPSSYRSDVPCFDYITPAEFVAAVNTDDMAYTKTCGTCIEVKCVDGPTRGHAWSKNKEPACSAGTTVTVQITDSCPCAQNPSNAGWCCDGAGTGAEFRHVDLSNAAFAQIADPRSGVIDVMYRQVRCPAAYSAESRGAVWQTWEDRFQTTVADLTDVTGTLSRVEQADPELFRGALDPFARDQTREAAAYGNFSTPGASGVVG